MDGFHNRIYPADFDNDGLAELMFVDYDGNRALFYDGDPQTGYTLAGVEAIDGWPQQDVITEDFNGDGLADVIIPSGSSRTTMLLNRGDWEFDYGLFMVRWGASSARALDVSGDGVLDVVFGNAKEIAGYVNDGSGAFSGGSQSYALDSAHMTTADVDGDGRQEILASPYFDWNAPPSSMDITVVWLATPGQRSIKSRVLDFHVPVWRLIPFHPTSEGPADLLTTAPESGDFIRLVNDGTGRFTPESFGPVQASVEALVADVDDDGFEDIVVGTRVFFNVAGEVRSTSVRFATSSAHRPLAYADMDGDGKRDMVFYDWNRQGVLIYPGRP